MSLGNQNRSYGNYNNKTDSGGNQKWITEGFDWDWLNDAGFGSDAMSQLKSTYSGGPKTAQTRTAMSDFMRHQQAQNKALDTRKDSLQGLYDYRDRSRGNFRRFFWCH